MKDLTQTAWINAEKLGATSVLYDGTRLMQRRNAPTATGIDRVDIRYAGFLLNRRNTRLRLCWNCESGVALMPDEVATALIHWLELRWMGLDRTIDQSAWKVYDALLKTSDGVRELRARTADTVGPPPSETLYVNTSHHSLNDRKYLTEIRDFHASRMAFYIHDLIPISHPEYVAGHGAQAHRDRLDGIAQFDPVILANSDFTRRELAAYYAKSGAQVADGHVLHIGVEPKFDRRKQAPDVNLATAPAEPYFLMVGTIEPRKNHLSMLWLWREMAQTLPAAQIPKLVIVGNRGWNNAAVFDMLDRSPDLAGFVEERGAVSDAEMLALMAGARALLFPAFTEGWGMPLVEALSFGTPVIAADVPALREAGAGVPDYVAPVDIEGWRRRILDFARPDSRGRQAQMKRLSRFAPPQWSDHFAAAEKQLFGGSARPAAPAIAQDASGPLPDTVLRPVTTQFDEKVDAAGWHAVQRDGRFGPYRWAGVSPVASLRLRERALPVVEIVLTVSMAPTVVIDETLFDVFINGICCDWSKVPAVTGAELRIKVPPSLWRRAKRVEFHIYKRVRPKEVRGSDDTRLLSFRIFEIREMTATPMTAADRAAEAAGVGMASSGGRAPAKSYLPEKRQGGLRWLLRDYWTISRSDLFDPEWYRDRYPEVRESGMSPRWHFLRVGCHKGLNPGPHFDTMLYYRRNLDVRRSGMNALAHYLRYGRYERSANRL